MRLFLYSLLRVPFLHRVVKVACLFGRVSLGVVFLFSLLLYLAYEGKIILEVKNFECYFCKTSFPNFVYDFTYFPLHKAL